MQRPAPARLALAAILLALAPTSAGAHTDTSAWGTEPTPDAGFSRTILNAVAGVSATDAWAVGSDVHGTGHDPVVERWNGTSWQLVGSSSLPAGELLGAAALATGEAWFVGGQDSGGHSIVAHWDGTSVSAVTVPQPGTFNRLYAASGTSSSDVWAVGEYTTSSGAFTLVLHWNGSSWTQVGSPSGSGGWDVVLYGVAAISPDDAWAVGEDAGQPLLLHWNGTRWRAAPAPAGLGGTLRAVSATPSGAVWAVGDDANQPVTLRLVGGIWTAQPAPDPSTSLLRLNGVTTLAANDAWAVGFYAAGASWMTLTLHWNGQAWSVVASPSPDGVVNELTSGAALPGGAVLAVGDANAAGSLAERWNGSSWTVVPSASAGDANDELRALSVGSASDIWSVGVWHAGVNDAHPLALHDDGTGWSIVPTPDVANGLTLEGVKALAPGDAWAVGWAPADDYLDDQSAAMHWDGRAWTLVPVPQPGGSSTDRLLAVDGVATNDVWAVGVDADLQDHQHSVTLHWDGSTWSLVPNPCDAPGGLTGVTALSHSDVWAVGTNTVCRYDGTSWQIVPSPRPRPAYQEIAYGLQSVSAVSATDAWAVGYRAIQQGESIIDLAVAEHWNGHAWSLVTAIPGQALGGVDDVAPGNVWAVGTDGFGPVLDHLAGSSWATVPTPERNRGGTLAGVGSATGAGEWAAGSFQPGDALRTLVEHAPSATQGALIGNVGVAGANVGYLGKQSGSVTADATGAYQIGGLLAGRYTVIVTAQGCTPASATVRVRPGKVVVLDVQPVC